MAFAFFASDSFKISHIGNVNWRADNSKMMNSRFFTTTLVVLNEYLKIHNVLKLDVTKWHGISILQVFGRKPIENKTKKIKKLMN